MHILGIIKIIENGLKLLIFEKIWRKRPSIDVYSNECKMHPLQAYADKPLGVNYRQEINFIDQLVIL